MKNKDTKQDQLSTGSTAGQVEKAIEALEASGTDITSNYTAWRDIGFALASEFGEAGSEYFHRVSRMYPDYDAAACEKQYQRCLKSTGSGIGIGTFFHYFKEAKVEFPKPAFSAVPPRADRFPVDPGAPWELQQDPEAEVPQEVEEETPPLFPEEMFPELPLFFQRLLEPTSSPEERDMLLMGSLAVLSSCFPGVHGFYDGKKIWPNLYVFITAKASSGKGMLNLLKKVVLPIHGKKREEAQRIKQEYEEALAAESTGKEKAAKTGKPAEKMHFLPANSSATGMFQLLNDNDGQGLIFETEGDTLSQVFKSDYGNYSDGFRKAFQHETISYYRRTDREYVDIEAPALSVMLSGTPGQVHALIPSSENGLFSRFLFYHVPIKPEWKDVFEHKKGRDQWQYYLDLGKEFFEFWQKFEVRELEFMFSPDQKVRFNTYFEKFQKRYYGLYSEEFLATVRRIALAGFRTAMLFTIMRQMETPTRSVVLTCSDRDFELVEQMVPVLIRHSSKIFNTLPLEKKGKARPTLQEKFLDSLPPSFNRKDFLKLASKYAISVTSADRYIRQFVKAGLVKRTRFNNYLLVKESGNKE